MNEIKLIEEIEDAIHNKKYDELLYKVELKLKKLFYKYTTEDVLTLINRTIIFHNYTLCLLNDKTHQRILPQSGTTLIKCHFKQIPPQMHTALPYSFGAGNPLHPD